MKSSEFELHARIEDDHWWFKARRNILLDVLKKSVPAHRGGTLAEIGCGTGGNLKLFRDYYRVIGVDSSPIAVELARHRIPEECLLGDFRDALTDRWNGLDAVILADVLEHVDDDAGFAGDLIRRLRPGAHLIITVPAHRFLWSEHDVVLGHKRRYSSQELRALWRGRGVDELFFSPFNCILFPLIALIRIATRHSASGKSDLRLPAPWINRALYWIFSLERSAMKSAPLPWGASYLAVLRKR